jgi:uncharacterized protein YjbI with pentapeptide repeats
MSRELRGAKHRQIGLQKNKMAKREAIRQDQELRGKTTAALKEFYARKALIGLGDPAKEGDTVPAATYADAIPSTYYDVKRDYEEFIAANPRFFSASSRPKSMRLFIVILLLLGMITETTASVFQEELKKDLLGEDMGDGALKTSSGSRYLRGGRVPAQPEAKDRDHSAKLGRLHGGKAASSTTPPTTALSHAASAKGELRTTNKEIKKIFEENLDEARKSVATSRELSHDLPEITAEQFGTEIEKFRTEHPGEKISLAALKDRFKTDSSGEIILPRNIVGQDLHDVDFSTTSLFTHFSDCNLSGANFAGKEHVTIFETCNLDQANFSNITGRVMIGSYNPDYSSSCKGANFNGANIRLTIFDQKVIDFEGTTFEGTTLNYPSRSNPSDPFLDTKNLNKTGVTLVIDAGSDTEEILKIGTSSVADRDLPPSVRHYVKPLGFASGLPTHECGEEVTRYRLLSSADACEKVAFENLASASHEISPEIIKKIVTSVNKKLERYGIEFFNEDGEDVCQDYVTTICKAALNSRNGGIVNTFTHGRAHAFAIIDDLLVEDSELSTQEEKVITRELFRLLGLQHGDTGGEVSYQLGAPGIFSVMNQGYSPDGFPPIDSRSLGISDHETFETIWGRNPQYKPGDQVVEMENGVTQVIRQDNGTTLRITIDPSLSYTYSEEDPSSFQQRHSISGNMRIFNMRRKDSSYIDGSVIVIDAGAIELPSGSIESGSGSVGSGSAGHTPTPTPTPAPTPAPIWRPTSRPTPPTVATPANPDERSATRLNRSEAIGIGAAVGALLGAIFITYRCKQRRRRGTTIAPAPALEAAAGAGEDDVVRLPAGSGSTGRRDGALELEPISENGDTASDHDSNSGEAVGARDIYLEDVSDGDVPNEGVVAQSVTRASPAPRSLT